MREELPEGWASVPLAKLGRWAGGGTPSKAVHEYWENGTVHWVSPKDMKRLLIDSAQDQITQLAVSESATSIIPANSVLMVTRSGILDHTFPVAVNTVPVAMNQDLKAISPLAGIDAVYTAYFLKSRQQDILRECSKDGTTVSSIDSDRLGAYEVTLAPTAEQQRIVSKIDELFSRIDEGERALERVQKLVERYRQSVLKAAVTGELTREWREKNAGKIESGETLLARILDARRKAWEKAELDKMKAKGAKPTNDIWKERYEEPALPGANGMPQLPSEWCWLFVDTICFVTKLAGFEYTKHVKYDEAGDLAVLKAENAGRFGFKRTAFSHVSSESVAMLTRSVLRPGDLLMVFVGAGTGNVARVPADQRYFLGPNIGMLRAESPMILEEYLEYYLRSPIGNRLTLDFAKAVAQPSLSMGAIRKIAIAIPPLAEQQALVDKINSAFALADVAIGEIGDRLAGSRALRSSILNTAFAGHLVPQDSADEPASALLKRIAMQRNDAASAATPRRTRKSKA